MSRIMKLLAAVLALAMLASACGDDAGTTASGDLPTVLDRVEPTYVGDQEPEVTGGVDAGPFGNRFHFSGFPGVDAPGQSVSAAICGDDERIFVARRVVG